MEDQLLNQNETESPEIETVDAEDLLTVEVSLELRAGDKPHWTGNECKKRPA